MIALADVSRHVASGTVIFREGDAGDEMFFVTSGRVSIQFGTPGREHEVAVVEPGEFFGELALLRNAPRTATAIAVGDTVLFCVRRETFALMMNDDLEVVFRMLEALGRRLGETDALIADLTRYARRTRLLAHVLGLCLAGGDGGVAIDLREAAGHADVGAADAEELVRALVGRGIGRLDGQRWRLDPQGDAVRLAAAIAAVD